MEQEQQGAIGHARQARAKAALKAFQLVLVGDLLLHLFPFHSKGRVGKHVVEAGVGQLIVGQGVAELDVADVLTLDQHVRLADGEGLRVQLLAMQRHRDLFAHLLNVLIAFREESAGTGSGVINGDDAVRLELLVFAGEHQRGRQVDDVARGEVFPGGFVRAFGELADQLFKDGPHAEVADVLGAQVDRGEALHHLVEEVGVTQLLDEVLEVEVLEDFAGILAEGLHIAHQIVAGLGIRELGQGQRRGIEELLIGGPQQQLLAHGVGLVLVGLGGLKHLGLGGLQHALQSAQQGKGQDHPAVLGLLEITTQEVCDRPDKGGGLGMVFGIHGDSLYLLWLLLQARAAFLWPERAALTVKTNAARDWIKGMLLRRLG